MHLFAGRQEGRQSSARIVALIFKLLCQGNPDHAIIANGLFRLRSQRSSNIR